MTRSTLRAGLGTLIVSLTLALVAAPLAQATPGSSPVAPDSTGFPTHKVTISTDEYDGIGLVRRAARDDTDSHGKLDFKKVKKTFGKHTSWRSGFAAGWYSRTSSWGQFKNISSADKAYIRKWAKTHSGPNPKASALMVPAKPKPCTGSSGLYPATGWVGVDWLNSCDTNTLKLYMDVCLPVAGLVAAVAVYVKDAPVAVPMALLTVVCGGGRAWVGYAQDASDINAIKIYFQPDGKHGRSVYAFVSIVPQ